VAKSNPRTPKSAPQGPQEYPKSDHECCGVPQKHPKNSPKGSQSSSKEAEAALVTCLVMIWDMSFMIMLNTMLGEYIEDDV
jgi:hypothetical protein